MSIARLARRTEKLLADNSPTILTAIGVTGVITTAYLTARASFKAALTIDRIESVEGTHGDPRKRAQERFEMVWKLYIPAVATGVGTIACIVCANRIGTRRAAAMASAYAITEKAFTEYKEKVVEKVGENKERVIRDEIQQDRMAKEPLNSAGRGPLPTGLVWCKDAWSSRYFPSTMEEIKKAQNDLNYMVINHQYASLTDFYNLLALEATKESDEVGWNSDKLLEIIFTTTVSDKDEPVLVMDFQVAPIRNFWKAHP